MVWSMLWSQWVLGLDLTSQGPFAGLLANDWPPEQDGKLPSICHSAAHSQHNEKHYFIVLQKVALKEYTYVCLGFIESEGVI